MAQRLPAQIKCIYHDIIYISDDVQNFIASGFSFESFIALFFVRLPSDQDEDKESLSEDANKG